MFGGDQCPPEGTIVVRKKHIDDYHVYTRIALSVGKIKPIVAYKSINYRMQLHPLTVLFKSATALSTVPRRYCCDLPWIAAAAAALDKCIVWEYGQFNQPSRYHRTVRREHV